MKFIDFTKEQFGENDGFIKDNPLFREFISEYERVCDNRPDFSGRLSSTVLEEDSDITAQNVEKLIKTIEGLEFPTSSFPGKIQLPDVIFFIGTRAWDGHGIYIDGKFYVFFNMSILNMIMAKPEFNRDIHNLHEIIHAIHYTCLPEFYPGNYRKTDQQYLNKMIAEGTATYISGKLSGKTPGESLCFGLMDEDDFQEWIGIARESKGEIWRSLKECFETGKKDEDLMSRLFYMPGGSLDSGRFGYFYGMEIVRSAACKHGDEMIMSMNMERFDSYIKKYFENDTRK
ncbi:MAG: hypothetical protein K8T10_07255 [Candidatus Eremiobacteraeota bacterium]|nr:hypothetical protein [Candidatus Eremiobacteraeota bacterium]